MTFYDKYCKYKKKYINLKNQIAGNPNPLKKAKLEDFDCNRKDYEYNKNRLYSEIYSGFLMHLIGDNMDIIINYLEKKYKNFSVNHSDKLICKEDAVNCDYTNIKPNSVIPVGENEDNDDVHWIYLDEKHVVHDPYEYFMQIRDSHQFCQTNSLLLALNHEKRNYLREIYDDFKESNGFPLSKLWDSKLGIEYTKKIINSNNEEDLFHNIKDIIYNNEILSDKSKNIDDIIKYIINNNPVSTYNDLLNFWKEHLLNILINIIEADINNIKKIINSLKIENNKSENQHHMDTRKRSGTTKVILDEIFDYFDKVIDKLNNKYNNKEIIEELENNIIKIMSTDYAYKCVPMWD